MVLFWSEILPFSSDIFWLSEEILELSEEYETAYAEAVTIMTTTRAINAAALNFLFSLMTTVFGASLYVFRGA